MSTCVMIIIQRICLSIPSGVKFVEGVYRHLFNDWMEVTRMLGEPKAIWPYWICEPSFSMTIGRLSKIIEFSKTFINYIRFVR